MTRQLHVRTVADALVDSLRERILSEQLPGGTVIAEADVVGEYNVARPTARTAIERLVTEGLLTRGPHRSARVLLLNADDVVDLYTSRTCVEESALRRLAQQGLVPETARTALSTMKTALAEESTTEFVDSDIEFHRNLVDAIGAPRLSRAHTQLLTETRLCMTQVQIHLLLTPSQILEEHEMILQAIDEANPDEVARLLTEHLDHAKNALSSHLREHPANTGSSKLTG